MMTEGTVSDEVLNQDKQAGLVICMYLGSSQFMLCSITAGFMYELCGPLTCLLLSDIGTSNAKHSKVLMGLSLRQRAEARRAAAAAAAAADIACTPNVAQPASTTSAQAEAPAQPALK